MPVVTVDHNGNCKSNETGEIHYYSAGEPVDLPKDVVEALGDSCHTSVMGEVDKVVEKGKTVVKNVRKAVADKMVGSDETTTKEADSSDSDDSTGDKVDQPAE